VRVTLPGNPLGSVLRETARQARRSSRDATAPQTATQDDVTALQAEVDALQTQNESLQAEVMALQARVAATVAVTGVGGIGNWVYPAPFGVTPALVATTQGGAPYHVNILAPNNASTQFVVFDAAGVGVVGATVSIVAVSLG